MFRLILTISQRLSLREILTVRLRITHIRTEKDTKTGKETKTETDTGTKFEHYKSLLICRLALCICLFPTVSQLNIPN